MTELDGASWRVQSVGGLEVMVFEPSVTAVGSLVVLPDFDWPGEQSPEQLAAWLNELSLRGIISSPRSWWIDRPASGYPGRSSSLEYIVRELAPWVVEHWPGQQLAAMGRDLGGQGAFQLAYRHPQLFPIAAAIRPAIDFHRLYDSASQLREWFETQEQARQETVTLRLHPLNWPPHQWFACPRGDWRFDGCERLASKLTSIGIPFTADLATDDGPGYDALQMKRGLKFVADRLSEPRVSRDIRFGR